ncbi:MAG: GNAT family N-acetyltransferase, partial [Burkholderiaceae bacterium]
RVLMAQGLLRCMQVWPARAVRISAQARLERFYRDFGFVAQGAPYMEDGIPHLEMLRAPT